MERGCMAQKYSFRPEQKCGITSHWNQRLTSGQLRRVFGHTGLSVL